MLGYILFARMKVIVIIPAAGLGTRMVSAPAGKDRKAAASKQFLELDGTPVLVHTLRRFAQSPQINEIFVALRKSEIEPFRARLRHEVLKLRVEPMISHAGGFHGLLLEVPIEVCLEKFFEPAIRVLSAEGHRGYQQQARSPKP